MPDVQQLVQSYDGWRNAKTEAEREQAWLKLLGMNADQVYTIGIVARTLQPIIVGNSLHNVPKEGIYSWDPGAYIGMYRPDTFWIDPSAEAKASGNVQAKARP